MRFLIKAAPFFIIITTTALAYLLIDVVFPLLYQQTENMILLHIFALVIGLCYGFIVIGIIDYLLGKGEK